jgi:thymidylate synthase (FAD)
VPMLDSILGRAWPVLDDGFVRVIDYLGGDADIARAARVSYGVGTRRVQADRGLIRYLMRHRHTTPFEMCEIKLHVRAPMDVWRQWIRHRTASVNEYSTRYSIAIDSMAATKPSGWRVQSTRNKQGSAGGIPLLEGRRLSATERSFQRTARGVYEERLAAGIAREQARKDLPLSTYTEAIWKINLHNLLHFLSLRMDTHAQFEIRAYAQLIGTEVVRRWCPIAWRAFQDYVLKGTTLSSNEAAVIRLLALGEKKGASIYATKVGWLGRSGVAVKNREREEAEEKLKSLGFEVPWKRAY